MHQLTLDNGQIWREVKDNRLSKRYNVGDFVEIESAFFGAHTLTIEAKRINVRVTQVD